MKKGIIFFTLALAFFLCLALFVGAVEAPSGIRAENETVSNKGDGAIYGVNHLMEYKKTTEKVWTKINNTSVKGLFAGDYEVRYAKTAMAEASDSVTVTVKEGRKLSVVFIADGVKVATYSLSYGDKISPLPEVPAKAGYDVAVWDKTDLSYVTEDLTVNATYSAGSHAVLLPVNTDGYTVSSNDGMFVEYGKSYTFTVTFKEGYTKTEDFAIKLNGKEITLDSNGSYTIPSVTEDYSVTVEGVKDITPPKLVLSVGDMTWNELSFDTKEFIYVKEAPEIRVNCSETGSGILRLQIAVSSFALSLDELEGYLYWETYSDGMRLSENVSRFIYVRAIDKSGNVAYVGSDGLISDITAPAINLNDKETYYGTKTVRVDDDHLESVTVDGKIASASFLLNPSDKDYVIVATDKAGNKTTLTVSVRRAVPNYTVPTDLRAVLGQTLADVKLPSTEKGTFIWSSPLSTSVGMLGENKFNVTFIPYNTTDYQTVTGIEVVVTVSYQAHEPPTNISTAPETVNGMSDGKILGVSEQMEYRRADGAEWIPINSDTVEGLLGGTYYVRRAASAGYEASAFVEVTVQSGRMLKVSFVADGNTVATIETSYGQALVDIPAVPAKIGYNHTTPYWDVTDLSFIVEDMTVNAVYIPNTYLITFGESDRYTVRENGTGSPVEYGKSYSFYIDIDEDYMKGMYFAVRNNGALILPDADGMYTIDNISEVHSVEVSGIVSNVSADKNAVIGINLDKHYAIGDRLDFSAFGSGMNNSSPEVGDERYIPISWTGYYTTHWDESPYSASFTLYREGECTITVIYRHEIYNRNGWVPFGDNEQISCTIQVHKLPQGVPRGNVTLSTVVCIVLIAAFTGVFITWYVIKVKKEKEDNE